MADIKTGLFIVSYAIGKGLPGAVSFTLNLGVYTPDETVSGSGYISQTVNPPININTNLTGQYTYMCVMPKNCHILVTLVGYPVVKWANVAATGSEVSPNVDLRMVLTEDWTSGSATYSFVDAKGKTHELKDVPVKQITPKSITEAING
jgi:hypothetical protein